MFKLATLCYLRSGGKTLMLHRVKKKNDMHMGKWNGLGGKFMPGETPEACAIREVQEESGLLMQEPQLRGILTFPGFPSGAPQSTEDDPNSWDWYTFVFVAHNFTGTLIDSAEGLLAWIEDDQLLKLNLWAGDRIFLQWLEQPAFFSGRFRYVDGELQDHDVVFYPHQEPQSARQSATRAPMAAQRPSQPANHRPVYRANDDTYCWVCNGAVRKQHCKIICPTCGFTRDCSDP